MKKKILSCLLAVAMLAGLFAVPVWAEPTVYDGNFELTDVTAGGSYTVNVSETASYQVSFEGGSTNNLTVTVNGKSVNRRTGGTIQSSNANAHARTFSSEVTLYEGENTIAVADANASKVIFTKLDAMQYTYTYLKADGTDLAGAAAPWAAFQSTAVSTPASVTFANVTVKNDGWYTPAAAYNKYASGADAKITIAGETFNVNGEEASPEEFRANCSSSSITYMYKSSDAVYLEASETYTAVVELFGKTEGSWGTNISAFRLIEAAGYEPPEPELPDAPLYDGDFELTNVTDGGQYYVAVPEDTCYYVSFVDASSSDLAVTVNGKKVNRRTGGNLDSTDGSQDRTFHNEVMLYEGTNAITITGASAPRVTFTKIEDIQYTYSIIDAEQNIVVTPNNVGNPVAAFQLVSTATPAYFEISNVVVREDGWYMPAVAHNTFNGGAPVKVTINGEEFTIGAPDAEKLFKAGSNTANGTTYWGQAAAPIELVGGQNYTVRVELYGKTEGNWGTNIGAFRLIETEEPEPPAPETGDFEFINVAGGSYTVEVPEDTSYYVTYEGGSSNNLTVTVNGETVSRRTGGLVHADSVSGSSEHRTFYNEVMLYEGENIISIAGSTATKVKFEKIYGPVQYTYSTMDASGAVIVTSSEQGIGNPWADFKLLENTTSPTVTFNNITVHKSGYYNPAVSYNKSTGGADAKITINGQTFALSDNDNTGEEFRANSSSSCITKVYKSSEAVYLEAGETYTATIELYGKSTRNWGTAIGCVRLYETFAGSIESDTIGMGSTTTVGITGAGNDFIGLDKFDSVTFTSSDDDVAYVDENGNVKGIYPGTVKIVLKADDLEEEFELTVTAPNGLVVDNYGFNGDGNIEITLSADVSEFDIVVAKYESNDGVKSELKGVSVADVTATGTTQVVEIDKPTGDTTADEIYEIYIWENGSMIPLWRKLVID